MSIEGITIFCPKARYASRLWVQKKYIKVFLVLLVLKIKEVTIIVWNLFLVSLKSFIRCSKYVDKKEV